MHYTCLFSLCCALRCWACHSVMFLETARELSTKGRRRTWRYWLMTIWFDNHINRSYLITLRGSRNNYWMMIASLIMQQDIPIMGSSMLLPDLQSVLIISHNFSGNWNKIVFNFWCHNVSKISSMKILSNNIEKFWGIKLSSVMVPGVSFLFWKFFYILNFAVFEAVSCPKNLSFRHTFFWKPV